MRCRIARTRAGCGFRRIDLARNEQGAVAIRGGALVLAAINAGARQFILALRASEMTCSNSAMLSTPGTRYLPTMKDGVPRKPKASAWSLLRLRMASMSLACAVRSLL